VNFRCFAKGIERRIADCTINPARGFSPQTNTVIFTGDFWRTFYTHWLPNSGYALRDSQVRSDFPTFNRHPDIEVYSEDCKDEDSVMQIYAPVVKA